MAAPVSGIFCFHFCTVGGSGDAHLLYSLWCRLLTYSRLITGERTVFWDHVGIVALAGQHLEHVLHLLSPPFLSAPKNTKPDIGPVTCKLPPTGKE